MKLKDIYSSKSPVISFEIFPPKAKTQEELNNKFNELFDELKPDVVFNQSQHIIKKETLSKAKIGFINRHGALLPKYRGRLAPFWQLLNKEKFGGLTFHFIEVLLFACF